MSLISHYMMTFVVVSFMSQWSVINTGTLNRNSGTENSSTGLVKMLRRTCPQECSCHSKFVSCIGKLLQIIPSNIPDDVEYLDLSNNIIDRIVAADLQRLDNLLMIKLSKNRLNGQNMEAGAFGKAYPNLTSLNLANNDINIIDADLFIGSSKITNLYLSQNLLTDIPDLQHLVALRSLILDNNRIAPPGGTLVFPPSYSKLTNLTRVVLANNQGIRRISKAGLEPLSSSSVKNFDLVRCSIISIEAQAFQLLGQLVSVDLSYNPLNATAVKSVLNGLANSSIRSLALSSTMKLDSLPNDTFSALQSTKLLTLQMKHNHLLKISAGTFSYFPELTSLDLSYSSIQQIEATSFDGMVSIKDLRLNYNDLTQIPELPEKNRLEKFSMENNYRIDELPDFAFEQAASLQEINLANCRIKTIANDAFTGLTQLKVLDLYNNELSGNSIGIKVFKKLQSLQSLNLAKNAMTEIVKESKLFSGLTGLYKLDMSENACSKLPVPSLFSELSKLQELNLNTNKLGEIIAESGSLLFTGLKNLSKLSLANNVIYFLPEDMFQHLTALKTLQLKQNIISAVDFRIFSNLHSLAEIDLSMNKISSLDKTSLNSMSHSVSVNLVNNSFHCWCELAWFHSWIQNTGTKVQLVSVDNYTCSSPDSWRGVKLVDFKPNKLMVFQCNVLWTTLGSVAVAAIIFPTLVYKNRWWITYKLAKAKRSCCRRDVTLLDDTSSFTYDAYVSCSMKDEDRHWVEQELLGTLSNDRDADCAGDYFLAYNGQVSPGLGAYEEYERILNDSAKILLVLSKNYLEEKRCRLWDINSIIHKLQDNALEQPAVIPILLSEIDLLSLPEFIRNRSQSYEPILWPSDENEREEFWSIIKDRLNLEFT